MKCLSRCIEGRRIGIFSESQVKHGVVKNSVIYLFIHSVNMFSFNYRPEIRVNKAHSGRNR